MAGGGTVAQLFNDLESNNLADYEEARKKLSEHFVQTKDSWLVFGMMDYFSHTNSTRIMEVLVKVQPPHDRHIFDRLSDWLRGPNKLPALTLFGHIVRRQPTWLYKVVNHALIKEILKLLKTEKEIVPLISALLCIITLLPILPSLMSNCLNDLFEVFSHLAAWNSNSLTYNKPPDEQLVHLQIGLYTLFQRLYGMYPCNFLHYLREYANKDKAVFAHTVQPLLAAVKMNPMLITSTKESEINAHRWKEMEPHDVVVECTKYSLELNDRIPQDNCECALTNRSTECVPQYKTPVPTGEASTQYKAGPFGSLFETMIGEPLTDVKNDLSRYVGCDIWSPSLTDIATPPPTGTVPHTPTPQPANIPSYAMQSIAQVGVSGTSPPEAAVEATPDTTPLKDSTGEKMLRPFPTNSSAARSFWPTSQPSSPRRKDASPFRFDTHSIAQGVVGEQHPTNVVSDKLAKIANQRAMSISGGQTSSGPSSPHPFDLEQKQRQLRLDSPLTDSARDDAEVTEINSQHLTSGGGIGGGPHTSDTLQDISIAAATDDGSPCSIGGLHAPSARTIQSYTERIKRSRRTFCPDLSQSAGNSPGAFHQYSFIVRAERNKLKRSFSWAALKYNRGEIIPEMAPLPVELDNSSPSDEEAISAATHFKHRDISFMQKFLPRKELPTTAAEVNKQEEYTQTVQQWPASYEQTLMEVTMTANKISMETTPPMSPHQLLEKYIEASIRNKSPADGRNSEEMYKDQIALLMLQLQYERHRREVHEERNRRLLGKNRNSRALEMDNIRLKDQVAKLNDNVKELNGKLTNTWLTLKTNEKTMVDEIQSLKSKYSAEVDERKKCADNMVLVQQQLTNEAKIKKDLIAEMESTRGELFDVRNELNQAQYRVDLGVHYQEELHRLQSQFILMGEIQAKCRDKFQDLANLRNRDEELNILQMSFAEEAKDLKTTLDTKSSQLDAAKARISDLEAQLSKRDNMFTDQKRDIKMIKDEYEERLNSVEEKYKVQKAIVLRMEAQILELYKNHAAVNLPTLSPESDKPDMASSLDHVSSPLSLSLASSDGLSVSLRSVTEVRDLRSLVDATNNTSGPLSSTHNRSASGSDVPVPRDDASMPIPHRDHSFQTNQQRHPATVQQQQPHPQQSRPSRPP